MGPKPIHGPRRHRQSGPRGHSHRRKGGLWRAIMAISKVRLLWMMGGLSGNVAPRPISTAASARVHWHSHAPGPRASSHMRCYGSACRLSYCIPGGTAAGTRLRSSYTWYYLRHLVLLALLQPIADCHLRHILERKAAPSIWPLLLLPADLSLDADVLMQLAQLGATRTAHPGSAQLQPS